MVLSVWIGEGIAKAIQAAFKQLIRQTLPQLAYVIIAMSSAVFLMIYLPMKGCSHYQTEVYRDSIPDDLVLADLVFQDGQSGISEGCGTAIFRLSGQTLSYFRSEGLAFLQSARSARKGSHDRPPKQYQTWKATPTGKDDYIFSGLQLSR